MDVAGLAGLDPIHAMADIGKCALGGMGDARGWWKGSLEVEREHFWAGEGRGLDPGAESL